MIGLQARQEAVSTFGCTSALLEEVRLAVKFRQEDHLEAAQAEQCLGEQVRRSSANDVLR
jgi:hypothetical protein